ncbi:MAG: AbrB/MazE/SpoVT family DNA-binding domain-containing protein [Rhodocyclales bacterium]|nr:AbrB/MazE/SpoVT family DNA-binding domain-containing protein [Rhodocyclales bacterium]
MPSRLSKWGNSLGVRIPRHIAEQRGLDAGDYLYIKLLDSGDILIRPVKTTEIPAGYAGLSQSAIPPDPPKVDKW